MQRVGVLTLRRGQHCRGLALVDFVRRQGFGGYARLHRYRPRRQLLVAHFQRRHQHRAVLPRYVQRHLMRHL